MFIELFPCILLGVKLRTKKVVKIQIKTVGLTLTKKIRNVKFFIILRNFIQI